MRLLGVVALALSGQVVSALVHPHPTVFQLSYELHLPSGECRELVASHRRRSEERPGVWGQSKAVMRLAPDEAARLASRHTSSMSLDQQGHHEAQLRASKSILVDLFSSDSALLTRAISEDQLGLPSDVPSCSSWPDRPSASHLFKVQDAQSISTLASFTLAGKTKLPEGMELFPIRISPGPTHNRRNMAFFGDGYTVEEKGKFLSDIEALVTSIIEDGTFKSTEPLFNFWAVFAPSVESGVGSDGVPKDTPFGLYRDGHELRGLYAAHRATARAACAAVEGGFFGEGRGGCSQMALVGNTDLYGGLGGEFTITTASKLNGALVLRHEIGHSLIPVGEEYEGGYAYFGVNSSPSLEALKWSHWLDPQAVPRAEDSRTAVQAYPWHDLSISPWNISFTSPGGKLYPRSMLRFSVAGLLSSSEMTVKLDGHSIHWTIPPAWLGSRDRAWIEVPQPVVGGLAPGTHLLEFEQASSSLVVQAADPTLPQICSVEISEYGTEDRFHYDPAYIGAFPTTSLYNNVSYRPTNEACLMRMVGTPTFCPICLEGLWRNQLSQMSLIDDLSVSLGCSEPSGLVTFSIALVPLGHLRRADPSQERYLLSWLRGGEVQRDLAGHSTVWMSREESVGDWEVRVEFQTKEVRRDEDGALKASRKWTVTKAEAQC